jgi:hypothetical protein
VVEAVGVDVIVDLPAVRPARLARTLIDEPLADEARQLRAYVRGARAADLPGGVRLAFELEPIELAALAHLVRQLADRWPFLSFRLSAAPPLCHLEVSGRDGAVEVARAVFRELGG